VIVFEATPPALKRLRHYDPQVLPNTAIDADLARFDGTGIEIPFEPKPFRPADIPALLMTF